jgi:hypothetical protein
MKTTVSLLLVSCLVQAAHADDAPVHYGAPDCQVGKLAPAPVDQSVHWNGPCKDGFADGAGKLEWKLKDGVKAKFDGTLAHGDIAGEATLTFSDGVTYIGTFKSGAPDGHGYMKWPDGAQYEGGFRSGKRDGQGILLYANGNVYKGGFKSDQPHGFGHADFILGGSVEGEYSDGKLVGKVKVVHAGSGRVYEGDAEAWRASRPQAGAPEAFFGREDTPQTGTRILARNTRSPVPPGANWDALTSEQKDSIRTRYLTLEQGDDPPYPANGTSEFFKVAQAASQAFPDARGKLRLYILVGKDGVPKSVRKAGTYNEDITRYMAAAAMAIRYKPALCHGEPCEMVYPFELNFVTTPL